MCELDHAWSVPGRIQVVEAAVVAIGAFALKKVATDLPLRVIDGRNSAIFIVPVPLGNHMLEAAGSSWKRLSTS